MNPEVFDTHFMQFICPFIDNDLNCTLFIVNGRNYRKFFRFFTLDVKLPFPSQQENRIHIRHIDSNMSFHILKNLTNVKRKNTTIACIVDSYT